MEEELTEWEKKTLLYLQTGRQIQFYENPIPSLEKKGYVLIEHPGHVILTTKGKNFQE